MQVSLKSYKNNGGFTRRPMSICYNILFRTTDVSDKTYSENQSKRFIFNHFFKKKSAVYEVMWKNMAQPDRPQSTI